MKAIFFDLDDTLFDHRRSARAAIFAVAFRGRPNTRSFGDARQENPRPTMRMR
jgi:FMN phosphatase YigB (HAD superfamily)